MNKIRKKIFSIEEQIQLDRTNNNIKKYIELENLKKKLNNSLKNKNTNAVLLKKNIMDYHQIPILYSFLKIFIDALDKFNIRYFLAYGTLLGAVRNNGLIQWDDDIDLHVFDEDKKLLDSYQFKEYIKKLGIESVVTGKAGNSVLKYYDKNSTIVPVLKKRKWLWPFIDIFFVKRQNSNIILSAKRQQKILQTYFLYNDVIPYKKFKFGEYYLNCPNNPYPFLDKTYKDWNKIGQVDWYHIKGISHNKLLKNKKFKLTTNGIPATPLPSYNFYKPIIPLYDWPWSKIYVINLETRIDRKVKIKIECDKNYISSFDIFEKAFDEHELPTIDKLVNQKMIHKNSFNSYMNKEELVKYLTTTKIFKDILRKRYDYSLIMDDTIFFSKNFKKKLNSLWKILPKYFDILYLGVIQTTNNKNSKLINKGKNVELYEVTDETCGSFAYIVNKRIAKEWIKDCFPINQTTDMRLETLIHRIKTDSHKNNNTNLKAYFIKPNIIKTLI